MSHRNFSLGKISPLQTRFELNLTHFELVFGVHPDLPYEITAEGAVIEQALVIDSEFSGNTRRFYGLSDLEGISLSEVVAALFDYFIVKQARQGIRGHEIAEANSTTGSAREFKTRCP